MDYKYIEQLLERYWQCETTLQEERILRAFFAQDDVPVWLLEYKPFFEATQLEAVLGDEFDARMLALVSEQSSVKARTVPLASRLQPLFKAAAIVAIVLTLGNAAQAPWDRGWDDPKAQYAKHHSSAADTVAVQLPIQAENTLEAAEDTAGREPQLTIPKY